MPVEGVNEGTTGIRAVCFCITGNKLKTVYMHRPADSSILHDQRGQASVFVLAMIGVVLVSVLFLYQSGRLTSEKMQLQNAADAAAYGASTLEARSLNFSAYTNRAMVANEVAVGQLVGLLSFADELKTTEEYADVYVSMIETFAEIVVDACAVETFGICIPIVEGIANVVVGIIEAIAGVLSGVGDALEGFFDVVVGPSIKVLSTINKIYSTSQEIYHGATYVLVAKNILD